MNSGALSRQIVRLLFALVPSLIFYWAIHQGAAPLLAADAEGLALAATLVGAIYAVVFAFVIFVIWGQFTNVEKSAEAECSYLKDLLRFANYLNPDSNRAVRRAVSEYAQRVVNSEWRALATRRKDQSAEKAFAAIIGAIVRIEAADSAEATVIATLSGIVSKAGERRDARIAESLTRIPPTLLALVRIMAGVLLLLMFVYPFHSWGVGAACFTALAVILFLSNLVMTDTDNPFDGIFNVSAQPFSDLMY